MHKRVFFHLLFVLLSLPLLAQLQYDPGYYIDLNGDKFDGYILNLDWKNNPSSFSFKENENGIAREIDLDEATECSIIGFSKYQRYEVDLDESLSNRIGLSKQRSPHFKRDTLFLKVLLEGEIDLLKYESKQYIRFFYAQNGEEPVPLVYKKYYKTSDRIAENVDFIQQIKNLYGEAGESNELDKLQYNEKSLAKVFIDLNMRDQGEYQSYGNVEEDFIPKFTLVVGSRFLNNELRNANTVFRGSVETSFSVLLGGEVKMILPFRHQSWSVYLGTYYQNYSGMKKVTYASLGVQQTSGVVEMKNNTLEINLGFRHRFLADGKPRYYFFGAGSLNIPVQSKLEINDQIDLDPSPSLNFNAGVAYIMKSFVFELSYSTPRNYLNRYTFWESEQQGVGLLVKYNF